MMIGLNSTTAMPKTEAEKRIWARSLVVEALKLVDTKPREGSAILMVKVGNRDGTVAPPVEVKFDSRETAFHIRSSFVQIKKAKLVDLGTLHISNVVTQATRVRADILRAVSDHWSSSGKVKMFVSSFNSRPVLHVTDLPNSPSRAMTFSNVIDRYGKNIKQENLEFAYHHVGKSFVGQLAQNFVVLWDSHVPVRKVVQGTADDSAGRGRGGGEVRSVNKGHGGWPRRGRGVGGVAVHPDVKCNFCKEMGHYKGDCPKLLARGTFTPRGTNMINSIVSSIVGIL